MSFSTRQRLSRESGRLSTISTRSPVLHSFFSSCALYFVRAGHVLAVLVVREAALDHHDAVLSILSLVTTPIMRRL